MKRVLIQEGGDGMDVNCSFFVKIAGDGTKMEVGDEGWRSNIPYGWIFFFFTFLRMGVELCAPDE